MPTPKKSAARLKADGSRHYSKKQLAEKEAREPKVPEAVEDLPRSSIAAPAWLPNVLQERFETLAAILEPMGLLTVLDADLLGRYLVAESNYKRATNQLTDAMNRGNVGDAQKWSGVQDRFFNQCRAAANDLGMSVSGRCRLEVPQAAVPQRGPHDELFG